MHSSQTQYIQDRFKVWPSTYETSFDNLWLVTNTLSNTTKCPEGFVLTICGLSPMHSATPPKRSEGFDICNYGLTTTQQQAHNRTPAGFSNIGIKGLAGCLPLLRRFLFLEGLVVASAVTPTAPGPPGVLTVLARPCFLADDQRSIWGSSAMTASASVKFSIEDSSSEDIDYSVDETEVDKW